MAKTIIIVENNNDKFTFEAIITFMTLQNILFVGSSEPVDIEWRQLSAESNPLQPNGLIKTLRSLLNDFTKKNGYQQVGIIWDIDVMSIAERVSMIQLAIESAYPQAKINHFNTINEFGIIVFDYDTPSQIDIKIACHFIGLNNKGEIEDLLKAIKSKPSPLADCVNDKLPDCLKELNVDDLRDKDLVKLWMNNYQRYDTLSKEKRTAQFTKWENVMKHRNDIFDFGIDSIPELVKLKEFLKMMTE